MQVNILKALDAQEVINQEIMRLKGYIQAEPDGELRGALGGLLAGLEAARTGILKETEAAVVTVPEAARKYIKAEDAIKSVETVKA